MEKIMTSNEDKTENKTENKKIEEVVQEKPEVLEQKNEIPVDTNLPMADDNQDTARDTSSDGNLGVEDLRKMLQIIEVCASRAAFKADEYQSVGQVYTNLYNFLSLADPSMADKSDENKETNKETNESKGDEK